MLLVSPPDGAFIVAKMGHEDQDKKKSKLYQTHVMLMFMSYLLYCWWVPTLLLPLGHKMSESESCITFYLLGIYAAQEMTMFPLCVLSEQQANAHGCM